MSVPVAHGTGSVSSTALGRSGACPGASTGHEPGPRPLGLLHGRHAEESLELPAELGGALVADRSRGRARVVAVESHEGPGPVEPDALDVLEWRAGRHELEVVVEDRRAHPR